MRFGKVFLALISLAVALVLASCGGTTGGGSPFGQQPGIYLVDQGNNRIVLISGMDGAAFISFGPSITGINSLAHATVGPSGHLYLVDNANDRIVRFDNIAGDNPVAFGTSGSGTGQFLNPVRVAVDAQARVYVVDRDRNELIRFQFNTATWQTLDLSPWFVGADEPDIAFDSFGHIFLGGGSKIVQLNGMTSVGAVAFGTAGTGVGQFNDIRGIALDEQFHIYAVDAANNRIVRIDNIAGAGWQAFGSTGSGFNQFNTPSGVGIDHIGKIYIADRNNHRLIRINDMTGTGWTELATLSTTTFSFPTAVFPHLPNF